MFKRRKIIGIFASVVFAAVGTGLLVTYVRSARHQALKGERRVSVLVVTNTIPRGTKSEDITPMVKAQQVPVSVVAQGAIASIGPIAGRVSAVDLLPGEQLVQSRFAAPGEAGRINAPAGMLQVTVALDAVRVLGGQLRGGDSVGVLVSFEDPQNTRMILQKVPVTDVRTEGGVGVVTPAAGPAPTGKLLVTLALDAPSVERVVFAAEHARLWLASEPKEANEGGTKLQTRAGVVL